MREPIEAQPDMAENEMLRSVQDALKPSIFSK